MEILIILAIFGSIVGSIAKNKGKSFAPWFFYGALLFLFVSIGK